MNLKGVLFLILLTALPQLIKAQEGQIINEARFLRLSVGYSPNSVLFLGKTPSTQTTTLQLVYGKKLDWQLNSTPVFYLINVTPYIYYNYSKRDDRGMKDQVKGFGFSPIGFGIKRNINHHFLFGITTAGGFIWVEKRFPTDEGRRLNYTFELSPELIFKVNKSLSFLAGYKFHHISNAQTGTENPGIDSNFIFFTTHITL